MKLILSSKDFLNNKSKNVIISNLGISINECKILMIPNENTTLDKIKSGKYHNRLIKYGFSKKNIIVFDYTNIQNFINLDLDAIYVGGGNTFLIIDKLRKCGFDKQIIKYVKNGVTYIGGSAGTHIVTKNIKHVENFDKNLINLKNYNALGLFDGIIFCHYSSKREKYYLEAKKENKYKIYTLTDEEVLIIEEKNISLT